MRLLTTASLLILLATFPEPSLAKGVSVKFAALSENQKNDDEVMLSELRTLLRQTKAARTPVRQPGSDLWKRWTHAVCVGCTPTPKGLRVVHTYPSRVLSGVLTIADDERERRGLGI